MNLYEIVGKAQIKRSKVEAITKEIEKLYVRVSFVMNSPENAGAKTVEFLKQEADRLESLASQKTILQGEIQALEEQRKLMPGEE